jgi:hypothetical protein
MTTTPADLLLTGGAGGAGADSGVGAAAATPQLLLCKDLK